ncbi:glycosyltransferase family 2 protein [Pontibacterium sp. N1Y112]|uniref:Glycosyltransferase family 2 protein n=1 Tax=Pontibacterium sinense TaxID=2781979 RepID=A0A8J7F9W7_9GAMM|nr:glycosyltransferase family 2 protein [Pontibacterium sinense]MBE9396019.1 glycosyltransferase family 2 protein [Pontibacterium sinense]
MKLSIVAPFHNEEENVDEFFNRVLPIIRAESDSIEVVCVNDGSSDTTLAQLRGWREKEPVIRVVNLSRNFGKENALTAGLDHATGDVIIPMDSDLQDPPELIPQMIEKWREGYDVVYARRTVRNTDTLAKRMTAVWYYRLFNFIADRPIPDNTGDFRLMDKKVLGEVKKLGESARFMKGLFSWVGFRCTAVEYERPPRHDGKESLNFRNLWRLALDGITAFSTVPLKIWSYIGMGVAGIAFLYGLVIIFKTLILGIDVPGYASIMVIVLFLGGVQLLSLGVIGEYVGRIYLEVKKRPHYIVDPEDEQGSRR